MYIIVSYDVSTTSAEGRRRLRRIARLCENYGQRVQNSVFECSIPMELWVTVKARLLKEMEPEEDSLRFYYLGNQWEKRVEHVGIKESYDPGGPLIV